MTHSEIVLLLNTMSQWMTCGKITPLARIFEAPLPVYVGDTFVLPSTCDQIRGILAHNLATAKTKGTTRFTAKLVEVEDQSENRCLALVEWQLQGSDDMPFMSSTHRYVMRRSAVTGQPQIELVEILGSEFLGLCDLNRLQNAGSAQIL